ncbi:MAG: type II toxin-antitoxin system prevent-host-death family antitoxin [Chloroflexota bacterium]|nr:type II toxin-antitoxin system prevent-host-death family antitoxin [Chloroflexota bacterium]
MTATVEAKEAGAGVEELTRRVVEERTPLVVAREGEPQVVVLPVAEYERLGGSLAVDQAKSGRENWWELARQSRERIHRERGGRPMPPIEDIIHDMREERDAQILANVRRR